MRSLTSTNLHARDSHLRPSLRSHTPVCMLATSTAIMSTGVTTSPDGEPGLLGNIQQPWTAVWPKALELSQGWLKALLPSYKWIRWEIATSGHIKYREAYQDFCESLLSAAKQCIPRGRCKNDVPCWDKECETLCRSFIRATLGMDSDRAASSLLSGLEQKQERWEKAVNSIDFSHSSRKAWSTINKLTRMTGRSFTSLGKLHRLATCEERGTQDRGLRD